MKNFHQNFTTTKASQKKDESDLQIKPKIRCAIYTRKSREDGLDQSFNSLDNQRLAAENFIASQTNEGWILNPDHYDDGAYSGGDTDRPAFQRLLVDIRERRINCVVVYKVERISRSNSDFIRMIEFFDEYKVNFVSVTESFNTGTASGRLMLGMLMNFAQYERELCSERVRHKIDASKKKGMWMGGSLPLGYDSINGKLIINENEAKIIRTIFDTFLKNESSADTARELQRLGFTTKARISEANPLRIGQKFNRKSVRGILENPLYVGFINHKGQLYDGLHKPIISKEIWDKAQNIFNHRPINQVFIPESRIHGAPIFKGIINCGVCNSKMTPTYSKKKNTRYRYYICTSKAVGNNDGCGIGRISANEIEKMVIDQILELLQKPEFVAQTIYQVKNQSNQSGKQLDNQHPVHHLNENTIINSFKQINKIWDELFPAEQARIISLIIKDINVNIDGINIKIFREGINSLSNELMN